MPSTAEGRINESVLGLERSGAGEPPGERRPGLGSLIACRMTSAAYSQMR